MSGSTTRIRPAVAADADALAALAALTFPLATPAHTDPDAIAVFVAEVLSAARFAGYLTAPDRRLLVAEDGGHAAARSIGYAMLVLGEPDDPEVAAAVANRPTVGIDKFYVHPDHHGSGVASVLMAAAIDTARHTGARSVWLGVNNENARANRFYEKEGFTLVGTKHFRIGDRLEDDFVRELVLAG